MNTSRFFFALFLFCSTAQSSEECKVSIPSNAHLVQEFSLGTEFACLYEYSKFPDTVALDFYSKGVSGGVLISSNKSIVSLDDVKNDSNIPNITKLDGNVYQLVWDFPNGVDEMTLSLSLGKIYFNTATKELRLPSFGGDAGGKSLVLINDGVRPETLEFSKINIADIFEGDVLRLKDVGTSVKVSSEKAFLYSGPSSYLQIKSYLLKGDEVKLLEYKKGFFKISYSMKNGKVLTSWIDLSSLI